MGNADKSPGLKPVKKVNIGNQVYEQMKNQIVTGAWPPEEKIPSENQLMEIFGVSRTTVRQAIQRLVAIGYLETKRGEGSYVKHMGLENYFRGMIPGTFLQKEDLREIFSFRTLFECSVAEMAAKNATDSQIKRLKENFEQMITYADDLDKYVKIDFGFHTILGECTQNALVKEIYRVMGEILMVTMKEITATAGHSHGISCHRRILQAIVEHNPDKAREEMRYHVGKNLNLYYTDGSQGDSSEKSGENDK